MQGAVIRTPEEGILLTPEQIARMCVEFFKRLLRARIQRAKGFAQVAKVQVKFVSDTLTDTFEEEAGWRTLKTEKDLGLKTAEIVTLFEIVPPAEAEALNKSFADAKTANAQKRKVNNEAKKKAADAKKSSI